MVLYARSDLAGVTVPVDAGGCGQFHRRPVRDGAPARLFAISCSPCESYLASDPLWTAHRWEIPLTPDEEREADALERQSERLLQQERREAARERGRRVAAQANGADEEPAVVVGGQPEPDYGKTEDLEDDLGIEPTVTSEDLAFQDAEVDLQKLTVAQLRVKAREARVSQAGSKKDLIARLKGA